MLDFIKTLRDILVTQNIISELAELDQTGVNTFKADNVTIEAYVKKEHDSKYVICYKCI